MKNTCNNCQYFREQSWCSNSKSPLWRKAVISSGTCSAYAMAGQKASLGLRLSNKLLQSIAKALRQK